jgi:plasmid replication initiation protein
MCSFSLAFNPYVVLYHSFLNFNTAMPKVQKNKDKAIVLIKKSNNLVESRYKFDIWETRFFLSILAQIRRDETDLRTYRIWYKDIIKTFGLNSGDAYASLRDAAKSLIRKPVRMSYYANGVKREQEVSLITQIDYMVEGKENVESNEYIDVVVQENMKPFLLQLQKNFTAYDLRNVVKLGVYSVRIYELLKQYESIGSRTLMIVEMKTMFDLNHEYQKYNDFYRWVIKPSEEEINRNTDLKILALDKMKEGRKVTALRFKFRKKTEAELEKMYGNPYETNTEESDTDYEEVETIAMNPIDYIKIQDTNPIENRVGEGNIESGLQENLVLELSPIVVSKFGVSLKVFMSLVETYTEGEVRKAIQITEKAILSGKVVNIAGFFVESLRRHYVEAEKQKGKIVEGKILEKKAKVEEIQKLEQAVKEEKNRQNIAHFEKQKAIFEKLIEEDATFWLELEEHIKTNILVKNQYDFEKDVFENMQKPIIAGTLMSVATKLRPQAFIG